MGESYVDYGALLSGRAVDVYTRMSNEDAHDYDKLKKALLTRYSFTEDGYRWRFMDVKPASQRPTKQQTSLLFD